MTALCTMIFLFCFILKSSCTTDTINTTKFLKDPETIISKNNNFALGFFSPPNSTKLYLGIWYHKPSIRDVIWVANKNKPLNDSSGVLKISRDGNLEVQNNKNEILWSSNVSSLSVGFDSPTAQIQDSGNFVLQSNGEILWQSFDHPTDSFLPNSKLTVTENGTKKPLQSWKSPSDPSSGRFTAGIDTFTLPQLVVWEGNRTRWRSGPWNGNILIGVHFDFKDFINAQLVISSDKEETVTATYFYPNESLLSTYMLSIDGNLTQIWWDEIKRKWEIEWQVPTTECDVFGKCGEFGTCNPRRPTMCQCLKGFQPRNRTEWSRGNWSDGCSRTTRLQCRMGKGTEDGFFRMKMMKVPENAEWRLGLNQDACRRQCLQNCSCLAYAYHTGVGCMAWSTSLIDIQEFSVGGVDLYLRLAHSELGTNNKKKLIAAVLGSIIGMVVIAILLYFLWRKRVHQQEYKKKMKVDSYKRKLNFEEIPLFEFETLAAATNNFHESNKLGQGGFGSVYKGKLQDGQEIAVKRLSGFSTQGLEEFMNEVKLISKLQHRNLVRLLGCSVEGQEKILVYECMPNKSLDAFLFGRQKELDWNTRFNIIEGICRGLQYLHRDSRLKIIHRDLKTSNILLDKELNPKISDFGMARTFGCDQDEADTRRVVGTYGYMSPEYAMEGLFSEKSDVFSFGVLLLEIVRGKRNSCFSDDEDSLSLLESAWKLWDEKNIMQLIDPAILEPQNEKDIIRCVQIGLLCVQEFAKDRPDVPTVISMLDDEVSDLPYPTKPGYVHIKRNNDYSQQKSSVNNISITEIRGR